MMAIINNEFKLIHYTLITQNAIINNEIFDKDNFEDTLWKCSKCGLYFSTEFEGSCDKSELCDECWYEVENEKTYRNI